MTGKISFVPTGMKEDLRKLTESFSPKRPLGFGKQIAPVMFQSQFTSGKWNKGEMVASDFIKISPAAKIFHYGQQCFEGMKAYRADQRFPFLFRPDKNYERLLMSSRRMAIPPLPREYFFEGLLNLVWELRDHIPKNPGESLYLRPMIIGSETGMGLSSSQEYLFLILASPSASYFSDARVSVLIERNFSRATPGGTGAAKVAGNYGGSILSAIEARAAGFQQTLWLDAVHKKFVEEFSGMNFFAVVEDSLYTPPVSDTILPGITRDSVIQLAKRRGVRVFEEPVDIIKLIDQIKKGSCTEIFACGTAAIVTPVAELGEKNGGKYPLPKPQGVLSLELRKELLDIQTGQREPPQTGWVLELEAVK